MRTAELSVGWVDPRVGLGWVMGLKWQMCEKIHVVYICNFVSSIDWQIRFVKTCSWCITASSCHYHHPNAHRNNANTHSITSITVILGLHATPDEYFTQMMQ